MSAAGGVLVLCGTHVESQLDISRLLQGGQGAGLTVLLLVDEGYSALMYHFVAF